MLLRIRIPSNTMIFTLLIGGVLLIVGLFAVAFLGVLYLLLKGAIRALEYYQKEPYTEQRAEAVDWSETPYGGYTQKYWRRAVISVVLPPSLFLTFGLYNSLLMPVIRKSLEFGPFLSELISFGLTLAVFLSLPVCFVVFSHSVSNDKAILQEVVGENQLTSAIKIGVLTYFTAGGYAAFYIYDRKTKYDITA